MSVDKEELFELVRRLDSQVTALTNTVVDWRDEEIRGVALTEDQVEGLEEDAREQVDTVKDLLNQIESELGE